MQDTKGLLDKLKQHDKLAIRVSSNNDSDLPSEIRKKLLKPHRKSIYFFAFVDIGSLTHKIDLKDLTITEGQLFFVLPNQIHTASEQIEGVEYFKLIIDQSCLSLLPKPVDFLLNPINLQVISFDNATKERVKMLFKILNNILHSESEKKNVDTILAYLNTLLTEFNTSYFKNIAEKKSYSNKFSKFVEFKIAIETDLTEQNSIQTIANKLSISTSNLYNIVKEFSGVSPKEFITNRLILEAQRKLYYSKPLIKELAYELGFNDPEYFSRRTQEKP